MLSQPQVEKYCPGESSPPMTPEEEIPPGLKKRLETFTEATEACKEEIAKYPKGERLEPWLRCVGREAKARGIEI